MRLVAAIAATLVMAGCRPTANVAIGEKGLPVISTAAEASFKDLRATLSEVGARHPRAFVHVLAAVVRADDDARVVDVVRAARAVGGAGFDHTILSRRLPSERTATRSRGDAPRSHGARRVHAE